MSALYICYQSVQEPLTQTQVIAYLEGLALAGHRVVLLTFEPRPLCPEETTAWRERLAAKGVDWHWLRYHKRPTVPATAWDVLAGIATGLRLIRKYKVRLVHARSHVPGLMALALKRLTGVKLLLDLRGFMADISGIGRCRQAAGRRGRGGHRDEGDGSRGNAGGAEYAQQYRLLNMRSADPPDAPHLWSPPVSRDRPWQSPLSQSAERQMVEGGRHGNPSRGLKRRTVRARGRGEEQNG